MPSTVSDPKGAKRYDTEEIEEVQIRTNTKVSMILSLSK